MDTAAQAIFSGMVLRPSKSASKGADPPFEDSEPNAAHLCRLLRLTKRHLPPTMALAQHRIMILEASLFYWFGSRMPYVEDILHVTLHVPKLPYLCGHIRHCKRRSMPGKRRTALKEVRFQTPRRARTWAKAQSTLSGRKLGMPTGCSSCRRIAGKKAFVCESTTACETHSQHTAMMTASTLHPAFLKTECPQRLIELRPLWSHAINHACAYNNGIRLYSPGSEETHNSRLLFSCHDRELKGIGPDTNSTSTGENV